VRHQLNTFKRGGRTAGKLSQAREHGFSSSCCCSRQRASSLLPAVDRPKTPRPFVRSTRGWSVGRSLPSHSYALVERNPACKSLGVLWGRKVRLHARDLNLRWCRRGSRASAAQGSNQVANRVQHLQPTQRPTNDTAQSRCSSRLTRIPVLRSPTCDAITWMRMLLRRRCTGRGNGERQVRAVCRHSLCHAQRSCSST